ncbi:PhzF family phenazine biosynthesis protein [Vibrio sp. JPW-9-11-11]|uniref:PhzF family phenazine biosynthesis protein n=1 Tax=Vibrio sp. JPW-9-11-11 TaxID=1416532 RepID=UPI0015940607|nr:PhzF family phenazine biosynthesis protein [Vibrio sp. JPW-9-11-11]NVD06500.1 PhzF family phenazine biosynthesis protein [Vibrio sp. JPW-9-11-11]
MSNNHLIVDVNIVNGFVADNRGGNPAGVVLNADQYSEQQMLSIAAKVGLSETAFVSSSQSEGLKLDFFTPNRRIAHCGHATIAAFSYLATQGLLKDGETSKETVDGPRKVIVQQGAAYMEQLAPSYTFADDWQAQGVFEDDVLRALNLSSDKLRTAAPMARVNTGNSFIVVAVDSVETLASIEPDFDLINQISDKLDLVGFYVFTDKIGHADATTRMFAPRFAINEEAATGMAAGPLACYLFDVVKLDKTQLDIRQGEHMQPASPSIIRVELTVASGNITGLMAGGYGKLIERRRVELPIGQV